SRQRAMATRARRLDGVSDVGLLARAEREQEPLAVVVAAAASIEIDHELRVDELAMLLQQKRGAVRIAAGFLVRGEGGDDVALGHEPLALQANERLEQRGVT